MALSDLVRDMVMAELELGDLWTGLHGARPPESPYIHRTGVGARLCTLAGREKGAMGVGSLIRSSDNGQSPKRQVG